MRTVCEPLLWSRALRERPGCIRKGRVRGVKALGVRYENTLAKAMPWATQGQWFEFADRTGSAYCQVDLLWQEPERVVVIEVKHTWVAEAEVKLLRLYKPVVERALGRPAVVLIACKRLVPGTKNVFGSLSRALRFAECSSRVPVFHWLGKTMVSLSEENLLKRKVGAADALRPL